MLSLILENSSCLSKSDTFRFLYLLLTFGWLDPIASRWTLLLFYLLGWVLFIKSKFVHFPLNMVSKISHFLRVCHFDPLNSLLRLNHYLLNISGIILIWRWLFNTCVVLNAVLIRLRLYIQETECFSKLTIRELSITIQIHSPHCVTSIIFGNLMC